MAAILPMAFVSGMMGPYMRPIPSGASVAMLASLAVAFIVTPSAVASVTLKLSRAPNYPARRSPSRIAFDCS